MCTFRPNCRSHSRIVSNRTRGEHERAGVFQARQEHDVGSMPQVVEAMRDVLPVQLTPQTMRRVVERMGRRRLVGQVRGLDASRRLEGEVAVVGLRLQQVVLIVEVEDEDAPLAVAQLDELLDPGKVPGGVFQTGRTGASRPTPDLVCYGPRASPGTGRRRCRRRGAARRGHRAGGHTTTAECAGARGSHTCACSVSQFVQILRQVGPGPTRCVTDETGTERTVRPPARGQAAIPSPPVVMQPIAPDGPPVLGVPAVGGRQRSRVSRSTAPGQRSATARRTPRGSPQPPSAARPSRKRAAVRLIRLRVVRRRHWCLPHVHTRTFSSSCDSSPEILRPRQSNSEVVYHVGGPDLQHSSEM